MKAKRWLFLLGAVARRSPWLLPIGLLGGALAYRKLRDDRGGYRALGIRAIRAVWERPGAEASGQPLVVEKSRTIQKTPQELYRFWRDLENLPRFMEDVQSVLITGERTSRWRVKGPAGGTVEWDAEITADRPNELIGWRSLERSRVRHRGTVRFVKAPGNRGTEVRVRLQHDAVRGKPAAAVAKRFGDEPGEQVEAALRRLQQILETGELATGERRRARDIAIGARSRG